MPFFIETRINNSPRKIVDYLKTTQRHSQSTGTRFLSFFVNGITSSNFNDLIKSNKSFSQMFSFSN
mgnify:CR=1 FL=1